MHKQVEKQVEYSTPMETGQQISAVQLRFIISCNNNRLKSK